MRSLTRTVLSVMTATLICVTGVNGAGFAATPDVANRVVAPTTRDVVEVLELPEAWLLIEAPPGFNLFTSRLPSSVKKAALRFAKESGGSMCVESVRGDDQYVTAFAVKIGHYLNNRYGTVSIRYPSTYDDPRYQIPWGSVLLVTSPCWFIPE